MSILQEANAAFNEYQAAVEGINPDLKDQIIKDQKQAIREKYLQLVLEKVSALQREANNTRDLLEMYSDPKRMLAISAVNQTDKMSPGDLALINSLDGLETDILATVAAHAEKPGVQLALLTKAADNAEIRKTVLDRVELPTADIKQCASQEIELLTALFNAPEIAGHNGPRKLEIGHRIAELEKILE